MQTNKSVNINIKEFAALLNLDIVYLGRGFMPLESMSVSRPGLQLAGFFDHFASNRIQVIGMAESEFLRCLPDKAKKSCIDELFKRNIPCLIVSRGIEIIDEILEAAELNDCPLMSSNNVTTFLINDISMYLNNVLAPESMVHGVLVDVAGVGVLLMGDAGIGKSEIALELVNRGHRLVADDSVIIKQIGETLIGYAPEKIRYFMEIRGLGIINIKTMFGQGAVRQEKNIDIIIELEKWNEDKEYDRIGDVEMQWEMLGVKRQKLLIPVSPGRNIPAIIETASRKFRLKQAGYDAAQELLASALSHENK